MGARGPPWPVPQPPRRRLLAHPVPPRPPPPVGAATSSVCWWPLVAGAPARPPTTRARPPAPTTTVGRRGGLPFLFVVCRAAVPPPVCGGLFVFGVCRCGPCLCPQVANHRCLALCPQDRRQSVSGLFPFRLLPAADAAGIKPSITGAPPPPPARTTTAGWCGGLLFLFGVCGPAVSAPLRGGLLFLWVGADGRYPRPPAESHRSPPFPPDHHRRLSRWPALSCGPLLAGDAPARGRRPFISWGSRLLAVPPLPLRQPPMSIPPPRPHRRSARWPALSFDCCRRFSPPPPGRHLLVPAPPPRPPSPVGVATRLCSWRPLAAGIPTPPPPCTRAPTLSSTTTADRRGGLPCVLAFAFRWRRHPLAAKHRCLCPRPDRHCPSA